MRNMVRQKRKDGLKRQAQIMTIALGLFAANGFNSTSVEEIIKKAGIAKGTFYLHFKGKNDILEMIIDSYLKKLYASITVLDISMDRPIEDIKQKYYDVTAMFISVPDVEQFVKLLLRDAISLDRSIKDRVNAYFNEIITMSAGYISKAQQAGKIIPGIDPFYVSVCIVGAVKEILYRWAVLEDDFDPEKAVRNAVEVFFRGMLA